MKKTTSLDKIFQKVRRSLIDSKREQLAKAKRLEEEKHKQEKAQEKAVEQEFVARLEDITQNILGLIAGSSVFAEYLWNFLHKHSAYEDSTGIFTKNGSGTRIVKLGRLWQEYFGEDRRRGMALFISVPTTKEYFGVPIMSETRIVLAQFWEDGIGSHQYTKVDSYRSLNFKSLANALSVLNGSDPEAVFKYFFERFGEYHNP